MRVIFMGTPDFAVPCLEALNKCSDVIAVYTQPDKPVGRKQILTPPPVKAYALENGLEVYQPSRVKDDDVIQQIKTFDADIIVVVAYGKILPSEILNASKYGCINVHASLLPKYRGAAPIQWAVLDGEKETGVTVMQMDEGLDTGDMLLVKRTEIGINETSEELFERLSVLGAEALIEALKQIESGEVQRVKQPECECKYAKMITRDLCPINWNKSAFEIHNQVRGLQTWPVAITKLGDKNIKIHKTVLCDEVGGKAGEVIDNKNELVVSCGDGKCVKILELQLEGKKRMDIKSFLQGNKVEIGSVLGG